MSKAPKVNVPKNVSPVIKVSVKVQVEPHSTDGKKVLPGKMAKGTETDPEDENSEASPAIRDAKILLSSL